MSDAKETNVSSTVSLSWNAIVLWIIAIVLASGGIGALVVYSLTGNAQQLFLDWLLKQTPAVVLAVVGVYVLHTKGERERDLRIADVGNLTKRIDVLQEQRIGDAQSMIQRSHDDAVAVTERLRSLEAGLQTTDASIRRALEDAVRNLVEACRRYGDEKAIELSNQLLERLRN